MVVEPHDALLFAQAFLAISQRTISYVPLGFPDLQSTRVIDAPSLVKDLEGPELFYDLPLAVEDRMVGSVRIAANTSFNHPFLSIQNVVPLDRMELLEKARDKASQEFPLHALSSSELVCFDYPRVGLLLLLSNQGASIQRIFDPEFPADRLLPVPEAGSPLLSEGTVVHSLIQTLVAHHGHRTEGFAHAKLLVNGMLIAGSSRLGITDPGGPDAFSMSQRLRSLDDALTNQPEGIGAPAEKLLEVPLIAQEQSDFCVLASIQMLLQFFEITPTLSQTQIRKILSKDPSLYQLGAGVLPENQAAAFGRCFSPEGFRIVMDDSPTWIKAHDFIDAGLPIKSGIFGHSRVAVGYQDAAVTTSGAGAVLERHRLLWINDPNSTQIRLELYEVETTTEVNPAQKVIRAAIPIKTNFVVVSPTQ